MRFLAIAVILISVFALRCGSDAPSFDSTVPTQVGPYITRIAPAAATAGDTVTIFGFGYSMVPAFNIVIIDGVEVFADTYSLVTPASGSEVESLTFTVPAGLILGAHSIYLFVIDNPSNTNITLTIN